MSRELNTSPDPELTAYWLREFAAAVEGNPSAWHKGYVFWSDRDNRWVNPSAFPFVLFVRALEAPELIQRVHIES